MKKSLRKAIQAHTEREVPCTENGLYHEVIHGKSHRVLRSLPDHCVDAYVTDPPAGIGLMGLEWDSVTDKKGFYKAYESKTERDTGHPSYSGAHIMRDTQAREAFIKAMGKTFKEVLRVLKPGAYALVWALPRTSHWTTTALENAGFEIRDVLTHVNVQGMPKGQDLGRMIARRNGGELQARKAVAFMKARREELGLSRQEFETRIFGKSNGNVRNWEDGISIPKPGLWSKIRKAMKLKTTPFDADMERGDKVVAVKKGNYGYQKGGERWEKNREIRTPTSDLAKKWGGWSTTLKPCGEHWILARAPISEGTTVANVLAHGTGALNIDACRVRGNVPGTSREGDSSKDKRYTTRGTTDFARTPGPRGGDSKGRWPPNFLLSHHPSCETVGTKKVKVGTAYEPKEGSAMKRKIYGKFKTLGRQVTYGDGSGTETVPDWKCHEDCPVRHLEAQGLGTSRSFPQFTFDPVYDVPFGFHRKPSRSEKNHQGRVENHHPTVKSISLMRWLGRLICPPGGVVLDTFFGSGTTGAACLKEGFHVLGIEQDRDFHKLGRKRLRLTAKDAKPELMKALFAPRSSK